MKRAEKAQRIVDTLERLYPKTPIPLQHLDPYTLTVAVVLSAQTTDKKVNEVTPRLFSIASTPEKMQHVPIATLRETIKEIGLAPQKAKAIKGLSRDLVKNHKGEVPDDFEALIKLPGVGRKTAQVVLAQAFGQPAFPVDTHIHRLAARWGLSRGKTADDTEKDLKKIFDRSRWSKLHLQIIFFGRERCPALYHDLQTCEICGWAATKKRIAEEQRRNAALRKRKKPGKKPKEKKA